MAAKKRTAKKSTPPPEDGQRDDVESLPFDQYQRYRLVADLLATLRPRGRKLRVLDVGGRTAVLRGFLPEDEITLVDVEPSEEPGLVLGTGASLPFQDGSFDVVAAFDTLEHVPPEHREAFVAECARVAGRHVALAGPYTAPEVDEAEELLQSFLKEKLGVEHRYLEEHRNHGLPDRSTVEEQLTAAGGRVRSFPHGNIERWLVLMCMEMYMDEDPGLRPIARRFFRFYNRALYASDHALPVYRHVVLASFGKAKLPTEEQVLGLLDSSQAPPESLKSITELGFELVAFDREKDVWAPEFKRLEGVVAGLEKDLDGHRQRLRDTESDLREHEATLEELESSHEKMLGEHAEERATLEADLGEHRASLAELTQLHQQTIEQYEKERLELVERLGELEHSLEEHREAAEHERAAAKLEREAAEQDLAEHQRTLEDLRAVHQQSMGEAAQAQKALEADLAGHAATLADLAASESSLRAELDHITQELERDRQDFASVRSALEEDLEGHRASLAELAESESGLRGELELVTQERERERQESAEVRSALEADLEDHRAHVAELLEAMSRAEREHAQVRSALDSELEAHRVQADELFRDLEGTRVAAGEIEAELARSNDSISQLAQQVRDMDAEISRLRGELRDRVRNLKRALSPKKPEF